MKKSYLLFFALALFACTQQKEKAESSETVPKKTTMAKPDDSFQKLFEEVNVVKMHLFGTAEAEPSPDDYPYVGKPIPPEQLKMLEEKLNAPNGTVFACYFTENSMHYILRIPTEQTSGDLVLAKWNEEEKKLVKVNDLAYLRCEEGTCLQQDAWLADLDDDRDLELVVRQHQKDGQGNISEEKFMVSTDNGSGEFTPASEALSALAVKDRYVMN